MELQEEIKKREMEDSGCLKKDLEMMKYKIVELNATKKNNEIVIVKLKEEKAELNMTVSRMERETGNLTQKLDFIETSR